MANNNYQVWSYNSSTTRGTSDHVMICGKLSWDLAVLMCDRLSRGVMVYYTRQPREPTYIISIRYTDGAKIHHSTCYNEHDANATCLALERAFDTLTCTATVPRPTIIMDIRHDGADLAAAFEDNAAWNTPAEHENIANRTRAVPGYRSH